MKICRKTSLGMLLGAAVLLVAGQAQALALTPADAFGSDLINSNEDVSDLIDIFGTDATGAVLLYKGGDPDSTGAATEEDGTFAASYETTFNTTPTDPSGALIDYISGDAISCPECFLVVKDGDQDPARYYFNIGGWNGTDDIVLSGFWPDNGAISHVSIWGVTGGDEPPTPPEGDAPAPGTLLLLAGPFLGLAAWRRRRS